MRKWKKVKDFDANGQDPDTVLYGMDPEGMKIHGRGQEGGGSQRTPQIARMTTGSGTRGSRYTIGSTKPSSPQKLRG